MTFELTEEEREQYREKGFLGPFTLCSESRMTAIRAEIQEAIEEADARQNRKNQKKSAVVASSKYPQEPIKAGDLHLRYQSIFQLVTHPRILERMIALLGPDIFLFRTQMWVKQPGASSVFWHQDTYAKADYGPIGNISCWLAIEEANEENGCVELLPGTHHSIVDRKKLKTKGFMEAFYNSPNLLVPEVFEDITPVKMTLKPGQFFIFDQLCFHGSAPNRTGVSRSGIAIRYIPTSTDKKLNQPCVLVSGKDQFGFQERVQPEW